MDYIHRLPYILGASVTIIVGMASYNSGFESRMIYIRMLVSMLLFFSVGIYARGFIYKISNEINIKKAEREELEKQEKLEKQKQEKLEKQKQERYGNKEEGTGNIDYTVDNNDIDDIFKPDADNDRLYDKEFSPLSVKKIAVDKENK
jgi:predicted membrane protein